MKNADLAAAVAVLTVDHHLIDVDAAVNICADADRNVSPLRALLAAAAIEDVLAAVGAELGVGFIDLTDPDVDWRVDPRTCTRLGLAALQSLSLLVLRTPSGKTAALAANPFDPDVIDFVQANLDAGTPVALGLRGQIQDRLTLMADPAATIETTAPSPAGERRQVLDWADALLARAVAERASDVHIQFARDGRLRIRFRVDSDMRAAPAAPAGRENEVIGALMNRCNMDVANLLVPQDGTFSFTTAGRQVDCRVSMLPQDTGPSMVLRLLDSSVTQLRLEDLGLNPNIVSALLRVVKSPSGTLITSGPTGSGKTTTMYALLRELDSDRSNIVTIEDPIEYRIDGIGQTQVRHDLGSKSLTFARALRSILRHDPDVILVGEIRDAETATTAMEASITGHLVLSTVHAPSAPMVFNRLQQMGAPRFMVAEALTVVLAQRLIRRLHGCHRWQEPSAAEIETLTTWGMEIPERVAVPTGCDTCRFTGFYGRLIVLEMLESNREIRDLILNGASMEAVTEAARRNGYLPLVEDGMRHVLSGATTVAELARVLSVDGK